MSDTLNEYRLSKLREAISEANELLAQSSFSAPMGSQFVVFVDGMDGDVYPDWNKMTHGVTHAFKNGAKEVIIKKWPTENEKGQR